LYRGLLVSVFGSAPSFAAYMTMYEYSKEKLDFIGVIFVINLFKLNKRKNPNSLF
jgi:hypothetical protein